MKDEDNLWMEIEPNKIVVTEEQFDRLLKMMDEPPNPETVAKIKALWFKHKDDENEEDNN